MKLAVYLLLIFVVVAGILGTWVYLTEDPPATTSLIANNVTVVDYRAMPAGFNQLTEHLFSKRLFNKSDGQSTRFTKLNCGIDFRNFFDRSRPMELLDTGSGVAIGDFDNDGFQDIYLVGGDISNKLYRNLGNFEFQDVTEFAGVSGRVRDKNLFGSGAAFADIDNDGDLDLYVCNMASPNLLFVNQGDGTFKEQAFQRNVAHVGASKVANFCDYDHDGDLDFYLATYQDRYPDRSVDPVEIVNGKKQIKEAFVEQFYLADGHVLKAGQKDFLFRNDGNGVFEDVTDSAGLVDYGTTLAAIWFDYDGDGWQDIYASNDFHAPDRLFKNNRDGTFTDVLPTAVKHTPWFSMGNDAGDLNNDGFDDLFTADMSGTTHYRRKVDMGDMGDSAFFLTWGSPRQYMKNGLYINSGEGSFFEIASMAGVSSTDWTWSTRLVDLDNDGRLDIYVTNGHIRDIMNADITNEIDRLNESKSEQEAFNDFYVKIPPRKETNASFRNLGNFQFERTSESWGLDHNGISHGAAFSDLDGDGDLDLVVNNYDENCSVYRNDGDPSAVALFELRCNRNNFFGIGTRVEVWQGEHYQQKTLHSARGYLSADALVLHFGFPTASTIDRVLVTWPDGTSEELSDLKTGFQYRVIESSANTVASNDRKSVGRTLFAEQATDTGLNFSHKESDFDDFAREPLLPYKLSELGAATAWSDVNGDQYPDLFCAGAAGQAGKLFINQNGQSFQVQDGPWNKHAASEDMGLAFFDADGDGDDDLYVVSGGNENELNSAEMRDRLYLNDGNGGFSNAPEGSLPESRQSGSCVVAADFDRDGDLDLFIGGRSIPGQYPKTPTSRLLINEQGKFLNQTDEVAQGLSEIGLVNSASWVDYDLDGWLDLVVGLEWGPVTFFRNNEGKLEDVTKKLGVSDIKGWWHGIAVADLDDDGDFDFVVTNQGTNTKYHADTQHPHRLYYSDFDDSGTLDLVESEYEGDVEYPARGRSCSSRSMPFIKDKFETFHDFASAPLADIYSLEDKPAPYREVNFLESAIFWNESGDDDSDRFFSVEALPIEAQFSPAFGVAVADFDNDSHLDIFLANNFFASQPETGFMDGGLSLLLNGSGQRKFKAVWPNKSGISISVASYGAATADFDRDGDLDIAVATNNDRLRLLGNSSDGGGVRIRLVGKAPNRSAIGSRIIAKGKDFQRAFAIQSGGNYLSQSDRNLSLSKSTLGNCSELEVIWPDGTRQSVLTGELSGSDIEIRQ